MSENFNLFGWDDDFVPKGRGRPPHTPTRESRNKVMLLLAMNRTSAEIASALNVTEPTLRKYYFSELRSKEEARFRVEGQILLRLYEQSEAGNVGALKELGRKLSDAVLADGSFQRRAQANSGRQPERQQKLGKKEAALKAAETPNIDTPLGQLMAQRNAMTGKPN